MNTMRLIAGDNNFPLKTSRILNYKQIAMLTTDHSDKLTACTQYTYQSYSSIRQLCLLVSPLGIEPRSTI